MVMGKDKKKSRFLPLIPIENEAIPETKLFTWGLIPPGQTFGKEEGTEVDARGKTMVKQPAQIEVISKETQKPLSLISIAASENHLVGVTSDYELVGCGSNSLGQLLSFSRNIATIPYSAMRSLPSPGEGALGKLKVVQVAAGRDFTAYLTHVGRVYTFGANHYGQLGHSHDRNNTFVHPRMVTGIPHEICVSVACGELSTYVLTKHGKVFSCGCGRNGRLGTAKLNNMNQLPFLSNLLKLPGGAGKYGRIEHDQIEMKEVQGALKGTPVVSIAAGTAHCLAVTVTGKTYGWGSNSKNQLGLLNPTRVVSLPSERDSDLVLDDLGDDGICTPVRLDVTDASECAAGKFHSIFVSSSRKQLFVAGDNTNGQLGPIGGIDVPVFRELPWADFNGSHGCVVKVSCAEMASSLLLESGETLLFGSDMKEIPGVVVKIGEKAYRHISDETFDMTIAGQMQFILTSKAASGPGGMRAQHLARRVPLKSRIPIGTTSEKVFQADKKKLFYTLRRTIFDMHTLNASFLKGGDFVGSDAKGFESSNIDIDGMIKSMNLFKENIVSKLEPLKVRQMISSLVAQMDRAAANVTEPDQLRAYFILALSPLLPEVSPREHEILIVSIFKMPPLSRRLLFSWIYRDIIEPSVDLALELIVNPMLKRLDAHINYRKYTDQALVLCKFLNSMYLMCKHRELTSSVFDSVTIPSTAFYTTALDSFSDHDLDQMYSGWRAAIKNGGAEVNGRAGDRRRNGGLMDFIAGAGQNDNCIAEGDTYGLEDIGLKFLTVVDDIGETALIDQEAEFVLFRHPFLLSANTKRLFMKSEDRISQIQSMVQLSLNSRIPQNLILEVSRGDNMLQETFTRISDLHESEPYLLQRPLQVKFRGEEGLDAGGVKKEFFLLLSARLFSPLFDNFQAISGSNLLWFNGKFNPDKVKGKLVKFQHIPQAVKATVSADETLSLRTIGIIIGLAVYNDTLIDVQFPPAMYNLLLGNLHVNDLDLKRYRLFDAKAAQQLEYILKIEDEDELESLCLNFAVTQEAYGDVKEVELCLNGSNINVDMTNRQEYVKLYIRYQMFSPLLQARAAILVEGFNKVIPPSGIAFKLFNADELELLLCGTPELEFADLKEKCQYEGGYNAEHKTIKTFWKIVEAFEYSERQLFLKFCTGASKAPAGGLKNMKFKIQRAGPDSNQLPTSYTCFNTLLLPEYSSEEKMSRLLKLAIENSEGFGLQ